MSEQKTCPFKRPMNMDVVGVCLPNCALWVRSTAPFLPGGYCGEIADVGKFFAEEAEAHRVAEESSE